MRLLIAAIGKLKDAEERAICARYAKRLDASGKSVGLGPLEIIEFPESRAGNVDNRRRDEADRLLQSVAAVPLKIALNGRGRSYPSDVFANLLKKKADSGVKSCAFLIGGPDGHGSDVLDACDFELSLGAFTLPHGLARVVLIEQLYRAATILTGHPYHRA